nr:MAG TPA: hypothetical protein [Bacteriophage sp.]
MNRAAQTSIPLLNNKHTHQETPWANPMGFNFVYITFTPYYIKMLIP